MVVQSAGAFLGVAIALGAITWMLAARPAWLRTSVLGALVLTASAAPLVWRGPYAALLTGPPATGSAQGPSILVIVMDTVGAARLSLYGAERPTTPRLEAFLRGRENVAIFPQAYSNGSWTVPSHASLVTGLIPSEHGAHRRKGNPSNRQVFALHAETTLPEVLREGGYHTVGVLSNWIPLMRGFSRGFVALYRPRFPRELQLLGERLRSILVPGWYAEATKHYPEAEAVTQLALREVARCASRACFILLNYMDAHEPYIPEKACRGRFGPSWSILEKTGEGKHGGIAHYDSQVRIPLVVLPPAGERIRATRQAVSLIDLTATFAEITGVRPVGEGRSLLSDFEDREARIEVFAIQRPRAEGGRPFDAAAVVDGRHKLILSDGEPLLFDLLLDPGETSNIYEHAAAVAEVLSKRLPPLGAAPAPTEPLSRQEYEMLRELGYVE